jgi:cytochrome c-type biogenesis protein CcsB
MNRFKSVHSVSLAGLVLAIILSSSVPLSLPEAAQARGPEAPFDYSVLERIPVFNDDRTKPLDTLARESMRRITSRERWSGKKAAAAGNEWLARDPMTNLLSMVFEADEWQTLPAIHLKDADVKELLGIDSKAEWTSYNELRNNPKFKEVFQEIREVQMKGSEEGEENPKLTPLQSSVAELHGVLNSMDGIFTGMTLRIVPYDTPKGPTFVSLQDLSSIGEGEEVREELHGLMTAFLEKKPDDFKKSSSRLAVLLKDREHELYPASGIIEKEIAYNTLKPFRKSWMLLLVAGLIFALSMGLKSRGAYFAAWVFYLGGFALSTYALYLRVLIAGRPPVSNMYESVVYMGWGVLLFAGMFELIYRQRIFGLCGSAMGVLVLTMADMLPFDPAISPLVPVLRSNYWLVIHVMMIVISYSAFGLAMMLGHFSLGFYLFAPHKKRMIRTSNNFVYRAIQVGVLLLAGGTILGGVWANESWGRFWGWDPKETWAFISLMGYLALLHSRYTRLVGPFGMAVGSILGFQLILMTWYGVNFVLAAGLHSYGFGAGGGGYIISYLIAEFAFIALVAVRYKMLGPGFKKALADAEDLPDSIDTPSGEPQPSAT